MKSFICQAIIKIEYIYIYSYIYNLSKMYSSRQKEIVESANSMMIMFIQQIDDGLPRPLAAPFYTTIEQRVLETPWDLKHLESFWGNSCKCHLEKTFQLCDFPLLFDTFNDSEVRAREKEREWEKTCKRQWRGWKIINFQQQFSCIFIRAVSRLLWQAENNFDWHFLRLSQANGKLIVSPEIKGMSSTKHTLDTEAIPVGEKWL